MCKQLLLFAQTTCSFWTQTKLWRTMGCVNSVGCLGDALHKRSLSTWCRLHQMVGPCRTAASSNRTHTDLKEWSFFGPQHTDMFCFLEKYNFPPGARKAGLPTQTFVTISFKETGRFCLRIASALYFAQYVQNCKEMAKMERGGKKNGVYFQLLKHLEALKQKSLNESSQNHSRSLVMPLTVSH